MVYQQTAAKVGASLLTAEDQFEIWIDFMCASSEFNHFSGSLHLYLGFDDVPTEVIEFCVDHQDKFVASSDRSFGILLCANEFVFCHDELVFVCFLDPRYRLVVWIHNNWVC